MDRPSSRLGFYFAYDSEPEPSPFLRSHPLHEYSPRASSPLSKVSSSLSDLSAEPCKQSLADALALTLEPLSSDVLVPSSTATELTPPRLDYPEHGLSRASLLTRKWMWAMREQEWIEHTASLRAQFDSELAYDGVSSAPPLRWSSTASRQNESSKQLTQEKECLAPLSIHPRIGSLVSSVLDPLFNQTNPPTQAPLSRVHQAHIDRWLMTELGLAVWTIKKWIWGCEVLAGEKRRAAVVVSSEEEAECDGLRRSESDCSVDSEKTLLDDDEQPMLKLGDTSCKPISETPLASPVLSNPSSGCVSYISLLLRESSICGSDLSSTHPIELLEQDDEGPWTPVNIDSLVTTDSA